MPRRVLMVAGEASGDAQGGELAAALLRLSPSLELFGIGGQRMRAAGVRTFVDIRELSIMGLSEVAGGAPQIWRAYRETSAAIRQRPPDLIILIDFPDFNLRLARVAQRAGVPVFYYVSPQVWAWRKRRIRKICKRVDRMVVVFPFETEVYRPHGLDVHFVGHPLAEGVRPDRSPAATREQYDLASDRPLVALLPGSREKEVRRVLPVMLEAAGRLAARCSFALACAPGLDPNILRTEVDASRLDIAIVSADTYNLIASSDVAAVTSGTATVECALLGVPMVVLYRMSAFTYRVARAMVRVPYVAMPNLLLGDGVVPELIQREASGERLAIELQRYLDSSELRAEVSSRLAGVRNALVRPGAAERVATLALELMS